MEVAKPKVAPKSATPKVLLTVDDPFFDEDDGLDRPRDARPGGAPSGLPKSGAAGPSVLPQAGPVPAGAEDKSEEPRLMAERLRKTRNAERARQRRLNIFIGAGVLLFAMVTLVFLAKVVFSRSPGNYGNASVATLPGDANQTEGGIDIGDLRRLHVKQETTPEENEYKDYNVFALGEVAGETKLPTFVPVEFVTENADKSVRKAGVSRVVEKRRHKSTYGPQEKRNDGLRTLEMEFKSAISASTCGGPCKAQMTFLLDQLNPQFCPCKNLYEHVCSKWQAKYSSLAAELGSYSVDDNMLDEFQATLARNLLKTDVVPLDESRHFFKECVKGTLVTKDNVQKLVDYLKIDHSASSAEEMAEMFARASRVGVSPFFDVVVKKTGTDFAIRLLPPSVARNKYEHHSPNNEGANWTQAEHLKHGGPAKNPGGDIHTFKAFLQALEHQLCRIIIREHGTGASCFLTPDSVTRPSWDYQWYKSRGLKLLAFHAASTLWPLFVPPEAVPTESNYSVFDSDFKNANNSFRLEACLHLVERYDPNFIMDAALAMTGKEFVSRGKAVLESFKRTLVQRTGWASNISLKFGSLHSMTRNYSVLNHSNERDITLWPINSTILERYLLTSTWQRWTRGINKVDEVLSASPTFDRASSTVHVPLAAFDFTSSNENPWLWQLRSAARVGPRFLKTILLSVPPKLLEETALIRCLRNKSTTINGTKSKTEIDSLDVEEVAAFAYSLEAFHSMTGMEAPSSGSAHMSTDGLFLYYYVFNKCTTLPSTENRSNTFSAWPNRHEVESVAMVFGGSLLRKCTAHPVLGGCLAGSGE